MIKKIGIFVGGIACGALGGIALLSFIDFNAPQEITPADTVLGIQENQDKKEGEERETGERIGEREEKLEKLELENNIKPERIEITTESTILDTVSDAKFKKVYNLLEKNYIEPDDITDEKIEEWLIRGLLYSVEDPYTDYFNEEQSTEFRSEMKGDFEGIGAVLEKRKKNLYITEVLKKRPAAKAGLLPGDIILEVDEKPVVDETIWETILRIRGEKGTDVMLKILRDGQAKEIPITRANIHVENVTFEWKGKNKSIGYFDIAQFGDTLSSEFKKAFTAFSAKKKSDVTGIIIDLRYNGGGYLDGAVDLASYFLPEGAVILQIETNKGIEEVLKSKKLSVFSNLEKDIHTPIVILVNGGTASSSEIFTSALKEHKRATVVGEKTFGKGVVQQIFPLGGVSSDEFVKITIARWLTPNGTNVSHENPIIPDEIVEWDRTQDTDEDFENNYDPQLEKALEFLEK